MPPLRGDQRTQAQLEHQAIAMRFYKMAKAEKRPRDTCSSNPNLEAQRGEYKTAETNICLENARKFLRLTRVLKSKT